MNEKECKEARTEETATRPYTLRRLNDGDLWAILDIVGKVFPDDLTDLLSRVMIGEKDIREVGALGVTKLVVAVLKNINRVHDEVYAFLSEVSGLSEEELMAMEFGTTPMMIWDIVKNEKNAHFFRAFSASS